MAELYSSSRSKWWINDTIYRCSELMLSNLSSRTLCCYFYFHPINFCNIFKLRNIVYIIIEGKNLDPSS